ncbi:MAG: hypothetical protein AB8C95_08550 [Phycisphaeraceae bacterium]
MTKKTKSDKFIASQLELALNGELHRIHSYYSYLWEPNALPLVFAALRDPRACNKNSSGDTFARMMLGRLSIECPVESVEVALDFVDDERFHLNALAILSYSGKQVGGEILGRMLLSDDAEQVECASSVLPSGDRLPEQFDVEYVDAIWPGVKKYLAQASPIRAGPLFKKIVRYDSKRAFGLLDELGMFQSDHPNLLRILSLAEAEWDPVPLGAKRLLSLMESLFEDPAAVGRSSVFDYALPNLARSSPADAKVWIDRLKKSRGPFREAIANAKVVLACFDDIPQLPEDPQAIDQLEPAHRVYLLAESFNAVIYMDGFEHFFYYEGYWATYTHEALLEIGAIEEAALLAKAIASLNLDTALLKQANQKDKAGFMRSLRSRKKQTFNAEQLASLHRQMIAALEKDSVKEALTRLDSEYYEHEGTEIEVLLKEHQLKHADKFKNESNKN